MTLIDGKILNILTDTKSSQACPVCGATPQKFINIKEFRCKDFTPKPKTPQYGISPLHSWFDFLNAYCIYHIDKVSRNGRYESKINKYLMNENKRCNNVFGKP